MVSSFDFINSGSSNIEIADQQPAMSIYGSTPEYVYNPNIYEPTPAHRNFLGLNIDGFLDGVATDTETSRDKMPFASNWTSAYLTTLQSLYAGKTPVNVFNLYKQQQRDYIRAAQVNAESIRAQGEVELRNLKYKNSLAMGRDINKIAGRGGNLSGSNLDVLMMQRKHQLLDETTLKNNTALQEAEAIRRGYISSANVAMQASVRYSGDKLRVAGALLNGLSKFFSLETSQKQGAIQRDVLQTEFNDMKDIAMSRFQHLYGKYANTTEKTEKPKVEYSIYDNMQSSSLLGNIGTNTGEYITGGNNSTLNFIQWGN